MKLSVRLQCYNQASYLEETLKSVISQKTDFSFEVVIGDDFSTDNSLEVIRNTIETNNNEKIKFILLDRVKDDNYKLKRIKLGRLYNFTDILSKCKGKYIALLDGDDYWTDPLKLQKQVDCLEKNNNVNICFHRAQILRSNEFSLHNVPEPFHEDAFDYIELIKHYNFIATASVLIRKPEIFNFPDWFYNLPFGDMGLYKMISQDKKIQCLDKMMCVYRVHDEGIYSGLSEFKMQQNYQNFYKVISPILNVDERAIATHKIKMNSYKMSKLKFPKNRLLQKIYNMYLRHK
nr:glycosyltransferase [uncultured Psychroserpens sp.]